MGGLLKCPLRAGGQLGWTRRGISRARRTLTFLGGIPGGLQRSRAARTLSRPLRYISQCPINRPHCSGGSGPAGRVPIGPLRETSRQLATGPNPAQHVLQRHSEWVLFTIIQVSHNPAGGALEARRGQHSSGGLEGSWRGISEPGQSRAGVHFFLSLDLLFFFKCCFMTETVQNLHKYSSGIIFFPTQNC